MRLLPLHAAFFAAAARPNLVEWTMMSMQEIAHLALNAPTILKTLIINARARVAIMLSARITRNVLPLTPKNAR